MLFAFVFSLPIYVYAAPPPRPRSWQKDLGDGLIFYATLPDDEELGYPKTGLYRDGELLYAVDGYPLGEIYFSNDGMSFLYLSAGINPPEHWGITRLTGKSSQPNNPSFIVLVCFYRQGEFVHSFYLNELIQRSERVIDNLNRINSRQTTGSTISQLWMDDSQERQYDRIGNTLKITTIEGTIITFDLYTGLIVSTEKASQQNMIMIGLGAVAATITVLFCTIARWKRGAS